MPIVDRVSKPREVTVDRPIGERSGTPRMTRRHSANDPRLRAWRAFLEAYARVSRRLDDELRVAHGLSLAEYDTLLTLAEAPGRRLRMNQLADRVILSRSGVTRLVDRLEADGLVGRVACASDARGAEAVLTAHGLARLRRAAPTHLAGIDRHFLELVDAADLDAIERSLGRVARRAAGESATQPDVVVADEASTRHP